MVLFGSKWSLPLEPSQWKNTNIFDFLLCNCADSYLVDTNVPKYAKGKVFEIDFGKDKRSLKRYGKACWDFGKDVYLIIKNNYDGLNIITELLFYHDSILIPSEVSMRMCREHSKIFDCLNFEGLSLQKIMMLEKFSGMTFEKSEQIKNSLSLENTAIRMAVDALDSTLKMKESISSFEKSITSIRENFSRCAIEEILPESNYIKDVLLNFLSREKDKL